MDFKKTEGKPFRKITVTISINSAKELEDFKEFTRSNITIPKAFAGLFTIDITKEKFSYAQNLLTDLNDIIEK